MPIKETVFPNRGNVLKVRLQSGGRVQDLTSITRVTLTVGSTVVDSDVNPEAFDWASESVVGVLLLRLGGVLTTGTTGFVKGTITIYDPDFPEGLVWEQSCTVPNLLINVCA